MSPIELYAAHSSGLPKCYRRYLPAWVRWATAEGLSAEVAVTPLHVERFAQARRAAEDLSRHELTRVRGAVRALGRCVGVESSKAHGGLRDCICGERKCRIGSLACDVCIESQRTLLARGHRNTSISKRAQALRAALRDTSASELGSLLDLDVRGVWLRYCGRVEVSVADAQKCRELVERGARTTWEPRGLEDFIYSSEGA